MKNGQQKNKIQNIAAHLKTFVDGDTSAANGHSLKYGKKEKLLRIYFIVVCGFIAALSIQVKFGIEQLTGGFLIASLLMFILYRDIMRYKPAYVRKYNMILLLGYLLIGTLLTERLFGYLMFSLSKGLEYKFIDSALFGIPIASGAMFVSSPV